MSVSSVFFSSFSISQSVLSGSGFSFKGTFFLFTGSGFSSVLLVGSLFVSLGLELSLESVKFTLESFLFLVHGIEFSLELLVLLGIVCRWLSGCFVDESISCFSESISIGFGFLEPGSLSVKIHLGIGLVFGSKSVLQLELYELKVANSVLQVNQLVVQVGEQVPKKLLLWLELHEEVVVLSFFISDLSLVQRVFNHLQVMELGVEVLDDIKEVAFLVSSPIDSAGCFIHFDLSLSFITSSTSIVLQLHEF